MIRVVIFRFKVNRFYFRLITGLLLLNNLFASCNQDSDYSPRPRGYYRIDLKPHSYKLFKPENCPFQFEIPDNAIAVRDSNPNAEPCWYYIVMPEINAQLYLTYKPLTKDLSRFTEDTRTLVYKHTTRASSIDETLFTFRPGVSGIIYELGGDAASQFQFYMTDSAKHFLRGALYFNTAPNADSLQPVFEFAKKDIRYLLQTLEWK